jgi:hypothetical protein
MLSSGKLAQHRQDPLRELVALHALRLSYVLQFEPQAHKCSALHVLCMPYVLSYEMLSQHSQHALC